MRHLPIPYVPVIDEVQEMLAAKRDEHYNTFKLPNKTKFKVRIWEAGMPEKFLSHIKQALSACERIGYFEDYKKSFQVLEMACCNAKDQEEIIKLLKV